ncbi:hypothetical protein [Marinagarivorans algicola]|uniref:hypothetical protein n=1 Tax=Marinagarivorans algicola TaxID=1513270 RepID=UPI0012E0DC05|nr:hypothetical protein [Marinagarivorans algicola]
MNTEFVYSIEIVMAMVTVRRLAVALNPASKAVDLAFFNDVNVNKSGCGGL